jgi:putative transposase
MKKPATPYAGHRFPHEIISHCVWPYFRFSLSYRDVEVMMAQRGVVVSYESIRAWCEKFDRDYAKRIRARHGQLGDTWHLDEVYLKIGGRLQYLRRAVDQDGCVLDILIQSRRSKKVATRFFRKLLRVLQYVPRIVVTDKRASYVAPSLSAMARNGGLADDRMIRLEGNGIASVQFQQLDSARRSATVRVAPQHRNWLQLSFE